MILDLLVTLLIIGLIIFVVFWFVDNILQLPANMGQVVKVVISVLGLIWLIKKIIPILGF